MPDDAGKLGYGSAVRIGRTPEGGGAPVMTELELLGDIEAPDEQVDEVQVTHQKSPGRRRQFVAGLIDSGEISFPMNYIPGSPTHLLLTAIKATREEVLIEFTLSEDGEPETFSGFLKGYGRSAPIDDKMVATATFRLSSFIIPD
ncbi:MAG: phage tail tube protein [Paracoccus sp. (in: a-proteobacteria)]|uniref:phage tail tube protein n=1 Tax=Paracoccus sp. TaxID=267 RepID=UPI0039194724